MRYPRTTLIAVGIVALTAGVAATQQREGAAAQPAARPPLFLSESWKQLPSGAEHPVSQESVSSANLELKLYGGAAKEIQLATSVDGYNVLWSGLCSTPVVAALRDRDRYVDLSGWAKIRWTVRTSGFHVVRPAIKLADGTWLVGDRADASLTDLNETEFSVASVRWVKLDIDRVVTVGPWVERPELSKVDEVGFVDLMPGSGHGVGGWDMVGRVEVFGKPVPR